MERLIISIHFFIVYIINRLNKKFAEQKKLFLKNKNNELQMRCITDLPQLKSLPFSSALDFYIHDPTY